MSKRLILIDAAHREEKRIAVLENGSLQDFDREAFSVKQLKGNIYLVKVTRVEQSLQAAFVDYGSERHGFLPFSDIHPDYYQIPESEKEKLKDLSANEQTRRHAPEPSEEQTQPALDESEDGESDKMIVTGLHFPEDESDLPSRIGYAVNKKYNIQDVIKPGQMMLVQVTKEERGNKGVSMSTYISIAGKYCVLMANTPGKGGVSRKVDNFRDRKILKSILNDLSVAPEQSVIIRTAGIGRKPEEIKMDYAYTDRLWKSIRDTSSKLTTPSLIHSKGDLIHRSMRDIYNDSGDEVVIEGKEAYESAMNFINLVAPNSAHDVKLHEEKIPLFTKYKVDQQIASLYNKSINLSSGGSIVIDQAEALVAIDVNSGRSTKESSVEETAFTTNLEAVKEIARQLRIRDIAGLIVIDFIDMYDQKHKRIIERSLRDSFQNDRAIIQIGRISPFGLLEMSRQRLGASFFDTITESCKRCSGTGYVRSSEIVTMNIMRAIRHASVDKQASVIYVYTTSDVITYVSNYRRADLLLAEKNYGVHILLHCSEDVGEAGFVIKKRKFLNDYEKRELDLDADVGKLGQHFEMSYRSGPSEAAESSSENAGGNRKERFKGGFKRRGGGFNRRHHNNNYHNQQPKKTSLLTKISKFFK